MEWIIGAIASWVLTLVTGLAWLDARKKGGVDLQAESLLPEGGTYRLRNHGNRTLYTVRLDAEHLAAHRIEQAIYGYRLVPKEPQEFAISRDSNMQLPDGVKILYRTHKLGSQKVVYVPLPESLYEWEPAAGVWVERGSGIP